MNRFRFRSLQRSLDCWLIVAIVTVAACKQEAQRSPSPPRPQSQANSVEDVEIRDIDSGISVHYRTSTVARSCEAQAVEMPRVWSLVVKNRLQAAQLQRIVLFPEDRTGQSVSIEFTKGAGGQWSSKAPCAIHIPIE